MNQEEIIKSMMRHQKILGISGMGMMWAIEFKDFEQNKRIIDRCIQMGVITDWFLFAPHKLRIAPPLTITKDELINALQIVLECIDAD